MRFNQRSSAATPQGGADFKSESVADLDRNEWPTSNRNQWPASNRNGWPTSVGIRSEGGPRGLGGVRPEDIDSFENLMLLCQPCHKLVD
ncbi:MAG TPA: hypothetical protein VE963_23275, partial [Reyranella sp.]|nr:hypothetical protein [Reyranella sp.]